MIQGYKLYGDHHIAMYHSSTFISKLIALVTPKLVPPKLVPPKLVPLNLVPPKLAPPQKAWLHNL